MRKLLIAITMLVSLTLLGMTPAHATGETTVSLDAEINTGPQSNGGCMVGSVHAAQSANGWTIAIDVAEYPVALTTGVCLFNIDTGPEWWSGTTSVNRRSIRTDGLQHAQADANIPSEYHPGYHSVLFSTFVGVHVTWSAIGKSAGQPDGSVRRDASTTGTISYCTTLGDCQSYSCTPPPPCPNGGMQLITAFTAPGYVQKSP